MPAVFAPCLSTGPSAIEIVLLGAPGWSGWSVANPATVGSATGLSCRQLVAGDCEFGDSVGDVAPALVQRIHHVPHRFRGLLQ
jgi:hypothetical protein